MSYLVLANGLPDFNKAVISLWFRVQQTTVETVGRETFDFEGGDRPRMLGIIPLLVFGKMFTGYELESESKGQGSYTVTVLSNIAGVESVIRTETHEYGIGPIYSMGRSIEEDPSYIGINCNFDEDSEETTATLRIRLQTPNFGTGSWVFGTKDLHVSDYSMYGVGAGANTSSAYNNMIGECDTQPDAGAPLIETQTNVDQSEIYIQQQGPDSIEVGLIDAENPNHVMEIKPDRWHHLLLSFDLTHETAAEGTTVFDAYTCSPTPARTLTEKQQITDPCQLWLALDDQNRTGKSLDDPRFGSSEPEERVAAGLGDNGVAPFYSIWTTFSVSGGYSSNQWWVTGARRVQDNPAAGMPTHSYHPDPLPSQNHEFGIPGVAQVVDRIRHVEMAEFQMWTGVTLDTSVEINRRAFVDEKGQPVDPTKTTEDDPRWPAERLLGKKPEILLHGDNNWIDGYNTGTLGVSETGEKIPGGQFKQVAKIKAYDPEPALGV